VSRAAPRLVPRLAALGRRVQRPRWLAAFAVAAPALAAVFALGAAVSGVDPGNAWGLVYGALAAALMLAAAALAVRRRTMRRGWGRSQTWVQLHLYGGALFLLLVGMHSGFAWPPPGLARWLAALSLWVVASGLAGVALRKWIPPLLASGLATEVLYERIPELAADLARRAEELAAPAGPVRDLYRRRLARELAAPAVRWVFLRDITGGIGERLGELDFLRRRLDGDELDRLDRLEELYRAKLELDAHYTLQRPLRWWLWAHLPASWALVLLAAVHVITVLVY
jgi:hypothetical protein